MTSPDANHIRGISEIVLVVDDVSAMAAFYRDVVGLAPEREPDDDWAWFMLSETDPPQRLALTRGPLLFEEHSPHPPGHRFGQIHFALHVPHADLPAALDRLRAHDVTLHGPTYFEWMHATSHYFYDPAGNLVEFFSPDS